MITFMASSGNSKGSRISFVFCRRIKLKALRKSMKSSTAEGCFVFTTTMMRLLLGICPFGGICFGIYEVLDQ